MTSAETLSPHQRQALAALLAREPLRAVLAALGGHDGAARIVGGAVRNALMGLPGADIDIATTHLPEDTMRLAKAAGFKPVPTGLAHGTVTVVAGGQPFEVTTLREDVSTDGRHAHVRFGHDYALDAQRRDFTMNALMLSADGMLHDDVGGLADIAARRVRFIGEASVRISEDFLRILRFFRFHASYGTGAPDPEGVAACIQGRAGLHGLSRERVRAELVKLVMAPGAVAAVELMSGTGLWQRVTGGIAQSRRLAYLMHLMPDAPAAERLAALCVMARGDAERLRITLKLSNAEHDTLLAAAKAFEALQGKPMPDAGAARQFVHRLGHGPVLMVMACLQPELKPDAFAALDKMAQVPDFPLSGRDALHAGVKAGPRVGQVLVAAEALWAAADFPVEASALAVLLAQAVQAVPE